MCVIAYKPAGKKASSHMRWLENSWANNPDGAGFMFRVDNKVQIVKGFMEWDEFISAAEKYNVLETLDEVVFHFRIASQGLICPENCHPFPVIMENPEDILALNVKTDIGLVHNGTLWCVEDDKFFSDTQLFVLDYLQDLPREYLFDERVIQLLNLSDDKFVLMYPDSTFFSGHFTKDDDWFFSNKSYEKIKPKTTVVGSWDQYLASADETEDSDPEIIELDHEETCDFCQDSIKSVVYFNDFLLCTVCAFDDKDDAITWAFSEELNYDEVCDSCNDVIIGSIMYHHDKVLCVNCALESGWFEDEDFEGKNE